MHGFTRHRRWSAAAIAAALTLILSGCTIGYVSIPAGYPGPHYFGCPLGVDLGRGHVSVRPNVYSPFTWLVPGNARVRFGVTRSNSTKPIPVAINVTEPLGFPGFSFVAWDGERSTGVKELDFSQWIPDTPVTFTITTGFLGASDAYDFTFVMAAVDANGNELGLWCRTR